MKRLPILTALAAFVLLLASCKNENKSGLFIPKDASIVLHVSPKSLSSKLTWEEIKKTQWFRDAYAQSKDSFAQKMMDNPEASGVDLKSDFAFFLKKRGNGGYSVFQGSIKDEAAFAALAKKTDAAAKIGKDGDWNVMTSNNVVTVWNKGKFAVINDVPMGGMNPMSASMSESTRFGADSLKIFVKQVMTLDNDESLFSDDRFAAVMKEDADMHMWMDAGAFYSDMAGMMSMMKIGSLMEGNVTGGSINFEDGKIAARIKQFYGKEMQKAMDNWKFQNVDGDVLNRIQSDNVIGVFAMNMDPAGLKEFLKTIGMDGMANMFLSKQNLSLDELLGATKGQFLMSVSDLQMKDTTMTMAMGEGEAPYTYTSSQPQMSILFATDVAKKATFDKLLTMVKTETPQMPFIYQLNNDWFVAGNKPEAVNGFAGGNKVKHAFTEKISGHPFGFYLDVQRLLKTEFTKDVFAKSLLTESAAVWKDVVMIANEYKNGVATSEMTINMVDGKTNSLKQLNQYIEKMNVLRKNNEKVVMENGTDGMKVDTVPMTTTPVPSPTGENPNQ
ncbi:MAG TPA: DUF4836 family protein [Flavisolibacter sp.]|nr:DUF4836 family protein [Flavisolibacter sp.]